MEIKKKKITEIIDSNGDLIGLDAIPTNGSDLESQANGTTDQNSRKAQQPFRYDMLGRFGFTMMPFMEGKDSTDISKLNDELGELMIEAYGEILKYYYKNPNKLKPDYRKFSSNTTDFSFDKISNFPDKILALVDKFSSKVENIDEARVIEDKVVDKRSEDEISNKSQDKEVTEKKIEKIAGLINKLDKKDINKLINLLEVNG